MNVSRDVLHPGPLESPASLTFLLMQFSSQSIKKYSPPAFLLGSSIEPGLLTHTFSHQKSLVPTHSQKHLGLNNHCQRQHVTKFSPPTHQFYSSKKIIIVIMIVFAFLPPYQSKKEMYFSLQALHFPARRLWKEKELLEQALVHIMTVHNLAVCASFALSLSHKVTQ